MKSYLRNNYLRSLSTPPTREWRSTLLITTIYVLFALGTNAMFGLFHPVCNPGKHPILLALVLVVFPTFLEESIFRGMLIPIDTCQKRRQTIAFRVVVSALAFTLWHPLNALTINPSARAIFRDGRFSGNLRRTIRMMMDERRSANGPFVIGNEPQPTRPSSSPQ